MALLEIHDLQVAYGGVVAVRGIDLSVSEGEVVVVLGANGAGKTSTLRAVAGQVRSRSGHVVWLGTDVSGWPAYRIARAGLALVPEGRKVFAPLTVHENLLLGSYTRRDRHRRAQLLESVYEMFPHLYARRTQAAGWLSGGEQQMLAFGRALMAEPKLILLDEPSMGLAPAVVDDIMRYIAEIASRGIGLLMVEQNAAAALEVATAVTVLERGAVVVRGTPRELRSDDAVVRAFLGSHAGSV
jgi:branched-chain amino acid transport system ATP-binding protein